MQVNVDVYGEKVLYRSMDMLTTVADIGHYVAHKIGLKELSLFELQASMGSGSEPVWVSAGQSVQSLVGKGLDMASGFSLKIQRFPLNFAELKHDPVALALFYRHLTDELLPGANSDYATD